jgi:hypothetical protein
MLLSLFLGRRDQRLRAVPVLAFTLLLCAGLTLTSCGGGGGGGGNPGTPAGSFTITVTASATSGSTPTHSTKLTLVVQ